MSAYGIRVATARADPAPAGSRGRRSPEAALVRDEQNAEASPTSAAVPGKQKGVRLAVPHVNCCEQKGVGPSPTPTAQKKTFSPNCQVRICDPKEMLVMLPLLPPPVPQSTQVFGRLRLAMLKKLKDWICS